MSSQKKIIITLLIIASILLLSSDSVLNAIIGFILVGAIPGTTAAIPSWIMVGFWCLVITAVTTLYIESTVGFIRAQLHKDTHRKRLPRRRYNSI